MRSPPSFGISSNDEENDNYKQRSRTPPSETFSYEDEHHYRRKHKGPSSRGLGNDAMSKALDQISKLPFTRRIEGARLPWWFHQPTFTIYNGWTDLVEHVSQFNQRMTIHSQNETLMCKVFPSSLGPVAMRWFNDLKTNSGLTNKKEWKRTSCKGKEMRRLSLKRGVILGQTDTTITIQGEISQGNQDQPTRRRLPSYFENRYIRFWRKSRMSHSSNGRIRWLETP